MHEVSLAQAVLELVRTHAPPGATVQAVRLEAGPLRGIDPPAMQWAWQAVTKGTECQQARLELQFLPWQLECPQCHQRFQAEDLFAACGCGCDKTQLLGGDELRVVSLDVEDAAVEPA